MRLGAIAAGVALLGVAAGAFGAHGLEGRIEPRALETFETAARYQLIHGLAAAFAADRAGREGGAAARNASIAFLVGALFFCGSLFTLALGGPRILGAVAPLGGLGFMAGWALLAMSFSARPADFRG